MVDNTIKGLEHLSENTINALIGAGYKTTRAIAISVSSDLAADTGLSEQMAEDIIAKAIANVAQPPLSAKDLLLMEQKRGKITTSSVALDTLLAGGPWTSEITEISGGFATGKSQLCFQLAVNVQLSKDKGGLEGKVFFVDTEGTFSAMRIGEIALGHDLEPTEVLDNILVARVLDSQHQTRVVQKINEIAEEQNIRLVIVDSIAAHFRSDFIGRDRLAERQQRIMRHASSLTNLAYVHDIAVIVTNQMVAKLDDLSGASEHAPALGEAWSHRPQTRIVLRRSPALARIARLTDSPRKPESEEVFYITNNGIRDNPRG